MRNRSLLTTVIFLVSCVLVSAALARKEGTVSQPELTVTGNNPKLPTVVIVSTGGTIAEKIDAKAGGAVPALSGADLIAAAPQLKDVANIGVVEFPNIDSAQMTPAQPEKLFVH